MSLKSTQDQIKRGAALIILTFIVYYGGKFAIKGGIAIYKYLNPPPPPGPTLAFGKLPTPKINSLPIDNTDIQYSLDTVSGSLPKMPTTLTVFEIDDPEPDLLSGSKARNLAVSFGFKTPQEELSKTEYRWYEAQTTRELKINIASGNFTMQTNGKKLNEYLKPGSTYTELEAVTRAKGLLSGKGLLPSTLENGIQKTVLVKIKDDGQPQQAASLSTAQLVKVDFFRNLKVDEQIYPVFGQNKKANVSVFLANTSDQQIDAPLIYYTTWNPIEESAATYPAKTLDKAWQEVQTSAAPVVELRIKDRDYFAPFEQTAISRIMVRDVYLAYFEDSAIQDFMIPIYVFEGEALTKDNQKAYYTAFTWAVDEQWLRNE